MDVISALVAYLQPPEAVQPRQSSLYRPPVSSQLLAGLDAPPSNSWGYAPLPQSLATSRELNSPSQHAASWAVCADGHEKACGSLRWRLRPPREPSSRGRLQPCGSHRAGRPFGRPQHGALSPVCPCPSDSCRPFGPPGGCYACRVQRRPLPLYLVRFS